MAAMLPRYYAERVGRGNAKVPSLIKCRDCKYTKSSSTFSAKQLEILLKKMRDSPRVDAAKAQLISCTSCTSKQVTELQCQTCDKWMGLDKFYKTQRKTPDNAQCIKCVTERVEDEPYEPGRDDDDHHASDEGESESSDDEDYDRHEVYGAAGAFGAMSMSQAPSTFPSQNGGSSAGRNGGGVQLKTSTAPTSLQKTSWATGSNAGTTSTVKTARVGFNPSAYGGSGSAKKNTGGGAWAKPPAGPQKKTAKAASSDEDEVEDEDEDEAVISDSD